MALLAAGLVASAVLDYDGLLWLGIITLIFTPMASIVASEACLWQEGDRKWFAVGIVLIMVIVTGLAVTALLL